MLLEVAEYLADMPYMLFFRVGIDKDVIQVYQHAYIEQVAKDIIHEVLNSSGHICMSEGHNALFKGAVAGAESCLPFITLMDTDQMVHVMKVDFQIESCCMQAVEEVGDAE